MGTVFVLILLLNIYFSILVSPNGLHKAVKSGFNVDYQVVIVLNHKSIPKRLDLHFLLLTLNKQNLQKEETRIQR